MSAEPTYPTPDATALVTDADEQTAEEPLGQFISLRVLYAAVRRGRRLWLTTMAIGLVAGLLASYFLPTNYSATTQLILGHSGAVDVADAMATDLALLQTQGVAQRVVSRLHLHESAESLLGQYSGITPSNQVMTITVTAPTASEATARANAVAAAFLSFRAQEYRRQNQVAVSALDAQQNGLAAEVTQLGSLIRGLPSGPNTAGSSVAGTITALQSEQTQDINQEAQIQQTVQSDNLNVETEIGSSSVLAPAVSSHHSHLKRIVTDGLVGLLVGAVVGMGAAVLAAAVSDRVRRREEVAWNLNAPVELNLGPFHRPRWHAALRLRHQMEQPQPDTVRLAQHLRAKTAGGQSSLAVVSIDSDEATALAVACCAKELIRDGREVLVMDFTDDGVLSKLFGLAPPGTAASTESHGSASTNGTGRGRPPMAPSHKAAMARPIAATATR